MPVIGPLLLGFVALAAPAAETAARSPATGKGAALSVEVAGEVGALPSAAPGVQGAAEILGGRYRVGAAVSYWLGQRATVGGDEAVGGEFSLLTAGLRAAWLPIGAGATRLGPTVTIEIGDLAGTGVGVTGGDAQHLLWLAFDAGLMLSHRLSAGLELLAGVELGVPVVRPRFVIEGEGDLHRPGLLSARARFGIGLDIL